MGRQKREFTAAEQAALKKKECEYERRPIKQEYIHQQ